ncbi:MAG: ABC transporter ATP-binding protein [Elainellaceae cyanobacterium]
MLSISPGGQKRQNLSTSPHGSADVLSLDRVTRQYDRSQAPAVCQVSLTLHDGELLGLLGPSGCGKTTLLRLIAGFERPQAGSISLGQQIVAGDRWLPPEKRGIGMVFQDYALFPHLTVGKNVAFGLRQRGLGQRWRYGLRSGKPTLDIHQRVREVLELVGLSGLEQRFPHQLSGGQQQRVALARALAPFPQMVLLDEPLSNLDAKVRLQLRQELRDIIKSAGASGIFVTHDQEEALSICDRVAVMRQGHIEQMGSPEDLYQVPASRFVAEFVTQANFVAAHCQEGTWSTAWCDIAIPEAVDARAFAALRREGLQSDAARLSQTCSNQSCAHQGSQETQSSEQSVSAQGFPSGMALDLMVRQEDVEIELDESSLISIRDRQFLGRENRYTLQAPTGQIIIARTGADVVLPIGSTVRVAIASDAVRPFPPRHGSEVAADGAADRS